MAVCEIIYQIDRRELGREGCGSVVGRGSEAVGVGFRCMRADESAKLAPLFRRSSFVKRKLLVAEGRRRSS